MEFEKCPSTRNPLYYSRNLMSDGMAYLLRMKLCSWSVSAFKPIKTTNTIIPEATQNLDASTTLLHCLNNASIEKTILCLSDVDFPILPAHLKFGFVNKQNINSAKYGL